MDHFLNFPQGNLGAGGNSPHGNSIIKINQDFAEIEDNNFWDSHALEAFARHFCSSFQGLAQSQFIGEFEAAAGRKAMGDAGDFNAF